MQLHRRPITPHQSRRRIPHDGHQALRPAARDQHPLVPRHAPDRLADQRRHVGPPGRHAVLPPRPLRVGVGVRLCRWRRRVGDYDARPSAGSRADGGGGGVLDALLHLLLDLGGEGGTGARDGREGGGGSPLLGRELLGVGGVGVGPGDGGVGGGRGGGAGHGLRALAAREAETLLLHVPVRDQVWWRDGGAGHVEVDVDYAGAVGCAEGFEVLREPGEVVWEGC